MSPYKTADEYYLASDAFVEYVATFVNPSRVSNHLQPLDLHTARECFRLIDEQTWKGPDAQR
jgi:hypothetical protein